jgi:butyrate kinase
MPPRFQVFVVNPGSTSTKLALFTENGSVAEESVPADRVHVGVLDQLPGRLAASEAFLARHQVSRLDAAVGRGGLIRPVPSGTITVNEAMMEDARKGFQGEHVSNLGCLIAHAVGAKYAAPAFVVDPVAVDEMSPLARYSGLPQISRQALSHALNLHAAARKACERVGMTLRESRWVVAHLGGGFSIVPMDGGRIVDTNNANSGGPFSPTRAGTLPTQPLIKLCLSGRHTAGDLKRMTTKEGGLLAHLGTDDAREVERRIEGGDAKAREVYEAMAYQVAKEIGAMAAVLGGRLDGIVLTGGLAHSERFSALVSDRVGFLGPVFRFPGEFEMEALAAGALRVLVGEESAIDYPGGTPCPN